MKVPNSIEDDIDSVQTQRTKRDRYWAMLYSARQEFLTLTAQAQLEYDIPSGAFFYYLKQNYGLQVELIDGKIAGEYAIIDEKKYLLFLLRFGS